MKKRRKNRNSNRGAMICISAVVTVLLVSLTIQSHSLTEKNAAYAEQEAMLTKQLEEENQRTGEIESLREHMQTNEYVEKVARDKLGLVYQDEILIKPEN